MAPSSSDLAHAFAMTDAPRDWTLLKFPFYYGCLIMEGDGPLENPLMTWTIQDHPKGPVIFISTSNHYGENIVAISRGLTFEGEYDTQTAQFINFFFNAVCYMNECGIETWGDYKKRAIKQKLGARKGSFVYTMPTDLTPRQRRARHEVSETGRLIHHRFVVRGHWRQQPVGPRQDKKFKLKWIKPYWKGPTTAEVVERVYTMKGKR